MTEHHDPTELTDRDRDISLLAWGFTLGFGYLTAWKGHKQTSRMPRAKRFRSAYFWLVWAEVVSIFGYGCLTWVHVQNYVKPSFVLFFFIFFFWSIQSQTQAQIIINRIAVIITDKRKTDRLRRGVFILIFTLCSISGVLWIGGSLRINAVFIRGDIIYIRVEGVIFICIDIFLNIYFIKCVKKHLIDSGLEKYRPLMNFVIRIIILSCGIDMVVVGMMSYPNPRTWLQLHPLGFIVKLNIELSMADLIAKLARQSDLMARNRALELSQLSTQDPTHMFANFIVPRTPEMQSISNSLGSSVTKPQDAFIDIESLGSRNTSGGVTITYENDESPLQEERDWDRMGNRHG